MISCKCFVKVRKNNFITLNNNLFCSYENYSQSKSKWHKNDTHYEVMLKDLKIMLLLLE